MKRKISYLTATKKGLSKSKLEKLLKKWQKKLLMTDWNLSLKIVDFKRKDFRQSGDFIVNRKKKQAVVLLAWNPWRDEEYTLLHELIHLLVYDFDFYSEKVLLKDNLQQGKLHNLYLDKLEKTIHHLTKVILERPEKKIVKLNSSRI